jgi:DNA-binding transcriptional regulator YiaG
MAAKTKEETLSYGGQPLTLPAMHGEFCSSIRRIRKNLKLMQKELAQAFGVGAGNMKGRGQPS